jgi:hypothetical protein
MDEVMLSAAASLLVSVIAPYLVYILKRKITKSPQKRVLEITDSDGRDRTIIHVGKFDKEHIKSTLTNEYDFEKKIENSLKKYKRNHHKDFEFKRNKTVDFLLKINGKIIAIEAKSGNNVPSERNYKKLKNNHPEIDELIFLFNSEIPESYLNRYRNQKGIQFISAPREKGLEAKITNILNQEFARKV